MISITKQGNTTTYGVNEYIVDTDKEINDISNAKAGSTAYSIESGNEYLKTQNGTWTIKGVGTGGGPSEPIDLPDNLLYSYEMTEEEFWDNYSNGTLNDGLYAYDTNKSINALLKDSTASVYIAGESMVFNNNIWVFSYDNNGEIIQINDKGDIVNKISILDTYDYLKPFPYFTNTEQSFYNSSVTIDNNGYIYLGGKGQALSIDTGTFKGVIIDEQEFEDRVWLFRQYSYIDGKGRYETKNNLSQDFRVRDGGTFGILTNCWQPDGWEPQYNREEIGYFKDGVKKFEIEAAPGLDYLENKNITEFSVANYENNEFYAVNLSYAGDSNYFIVLDCYDIEGNCNTYNLSSKPINHSNNLSCQLFIKNNILYGHLIDNMNEMIHFFLFDTIEKSVIQMDSISVFVSGSFPTTVTQSLNDIYFQDNYAILCLKVENMVSNGKLLFIKINYDQDSSYIDILQRDAFIITPPAIFSLSCVNGIYMYVNSSKELFGFDIINDRLYQYGITVQEGTRFGQMVKDELLVTSYSYEGDQVNCVSIDLRSGDIVSNVTYDQFQTINPNLSTRVNSLLCFPEVEQFIYGDTVFDYKNQTLPRYLNNSRHAYDFLARLNNNSIWRGADSIVNYTLASSAVSTLVHKNNIVFSKDFIY